MCLATVRATFFVLKPPPPPEKKKEICKDSLLVGLSSVRPSPRNCFSATEWNLLWILRVQQWKLNSLWLPWVTSMRIHPCSAELDPKQTLWQPLPLTKYDLNTAPLWLVDHHSPTWAPVPEHFLDDGNPPHILFCGAIESKSKSEFALHSVVGQLRYMPPHVLFL